MKNLLRNKIHAAASILPVLRAVYAENAALKHALKAASSLQQQLLADAGRMRQARAGLPDDLDIIVPVCNAAGWLSVILDAYERMKIDPLFIVDERSTDASLDILIRRNKRRILAPSGEQPTVESLLFPILHILKTKYILRLDDDELPSQNLLSWITENFDSFDEPAIGLPRRWIACPQAHDLMNTAGETDHGILGADYQYRLFQPQKIKPVTYLHSPGFELSTFATAPSAAVIYHLNWIVRSYAQRQAKFATYRSINADFEQQNRRFCLPEDHGFNDYGLVPLEAPLMVDVCNTILTMNTNRG